ncbi:MAG: Bax protein [Paraglaciecola sp.]|jgi:Bax protein
MLKLVNTMIVSFVVLMATILFIVKVQTHPEKPNVPEVIINLEALYVVPIQSSKTPVPLFASYADVTEKKRAFFTYLLPEIRRQNTIVEKEREMVFSLLHVYSNTKQLNQHELAVFEMLKHKYKLNTNEKLTIEDALGQLIIRVDTIPEQLILVQAANESGWGTSRFAVQGYNFFGLWCFKRGCGFVPKQRDDDAEHEVARFIDLSHSIMTYIRNLNRLYAYQELRQIRLQLRNSNQPVTAKALSQGLFRYSERGQDYIDELLSMLRVNEKYMQVAL